MLTMNRRDWWKKAWSYKDHGKSWDAVYEREHPPGFRWVHESFGTNWRMTELQGVIGRIQLARMPEWHAARKANALRLVDAAETCPALRVPLPAAEVEHAWYKFYMFVRPEMLGGGWSRDRIMAEINAAGVPCYSGSCSEVYLERAFDETGWRPEPGLPVAHELGETALMMLVHPTLSDAEVGKAGEVLRDVMARATC